MLTVGNQYARGDCFSRNLLGVSHALIKLLAQNRTEVFKLFPIVLINVAIFFGNLGHDFFWQLSS